jgi:hypothetical protein
MNDGVKRRRNRTSWAFSMAGALVASIIVVGLGPPGFFLARGKVCELGLAVGNYTIWTPEAILNVPDGGGVGYATAVGFWNYTFSSGSLIVGGIPPLTSTAASGPGEGPPQAGIFASYADYDWTFYRTQNVSQVGVASDPCTQPYVAEFLLPPTGCASDFSTIPLPDNASDAVEPHVWNATTGTNSSYRVGCPVRDPGTYVWFDSSLHTAGTGVAAPENWSLCHGSGFQVVDLYGVAEVPVVVTVPLGHGSISAVGFLTWTSGNPDWPTVVYKVPMGWNWTVAPVGPATASVTPSSDVPELLAFERSAC